MHDGVLLLPDYRHHPACCYQGEGTTAFGIPIPSLTFRLRPPQRQPGEDKYKHEDFFLYMRPDVRRGIDLAELSIGDLRGLWRTFMKYSRRSKQLAARAFRTLPATLTPAPALQTTTGCSPRSSS